MAIDYFAGGRISAGWLCISKLAREGSRVPGSCCWPLGCVMSDKHSRLGTTPNGLHWVHTRVTPMSAHPHPDHQQPDSVGRSPPAACPLSLHVSPRPVTGGLCIPSRSARRRRRPSTMPNAIGLAHPVQKRREMDSTIQAEWL